MTYLRWHIHAQFNAHHNIQIITSFLKFMFICSRTVCLVYNTFVTWSILFTKTGLNSLYQADDTHTTTLHMYQHFETNKQSIFTHMSNKDQPRTFTATWYTFFLNWIFPLFKVLQIRFFNGYQISSLHLIRSTTIKRQIISFFLFFFFFFFLFSFFFKFYRISKISNHQLHHSSLRIILHFQYSLYAGPR